MDIMNESNSILDSFRFLALLDKFAEIFNYPAFDDNFIEELSQKYKQKSQACCKELTYGGWICHDCGKFSNNIICNECYINGKEKHKNHKVEYWDSCSGSCDCGDLDMWDKNGFCPNHSGPFTTNEEIKAYLLECFHSQEIIDKVHSQLTLIFASIMNRINGTRQSIINTQLFTDLINKFCKLCDKNQAIIHILANVLIQKNPYNNKIVTHDCYYINEEEQNIEIVSSNGKKHMCLCSFLTFLFRTITTQEKAKSLMISFQKNYKLKLFMGTLYFLLTPELIHKNAPQMYNIGYIMVQRLEISQKLSKSIRDIDWFFTSLINYTQKLIEKKEYDSLLMLMTDVQYNFFYLIREETKIDFSKNIVLYKKCIDLIALFHQFNTLKEAYSVFQRTGYNVDLVRIEMKLLYTFSYLVALKQFKNEEEKENFEILNYLIHQIINKVEYALNSDEYSFHILLYRILSIYLTRFAFGMSFNKEISFDEAITYIIKQIPDYDDVFSLIYRNMCKCFGFIRSTDLGFWNYYGNEMLNFQYGYTHVLIFTLCDFSLFRYIVNLFQDNWMLNIVNCLFLSRVNNSYQSIKQLKDNKFNFSLVSTYSNFTRDINFNAKMLDVYLSIIRNNYCIWQLFIVPYYTLDRYSIKDELIENLLITERNNIINIVKQHLVTTLIINGNLVPYSTLINSIDDSIIKLLGNQTIEDIIHEITIQKEGKVCSFSVKDEYLSMYDSSMIIIPNDESKAQKYLMEFKSKQLNSLNITQYTYLDCLSHIQKNFNAHLCKETNITFFLDMFCGIISNIQSSHISVFINIISKYIAFICSLLKNSPQKERYMVQITNILTKLDNINSKNVDALIANACDFVKKTIYELINNVDNSNNNCIQEETVDQNNNKNNKVSKKKLLVNKYKKKFSEKNNNIIQKYSDELTPHKNENEKQCVVCRCTINENEDSFGYFGYVGYDYFIYDMMYQTSKEIYDTNIDPNCKDVELEENKRGSFRIYSCFHFIHFTCYENLLKQSFLQSQEMLLKCPLCKRFCNTYIPYLMTEIVINKELNIQYIYNLLEFIVHAITNKSIVMADFANEDNFNTYLEEVMYNFYYYFLFLKNVKCEEETFKNKQIMLLSYVIKSIQIIMKEKILQEEMFIIMLKKITNKETLTSNLLDTSIELVIFKIIFLCIVLNKIETQEFIDLMKYYLPYYSLSWYIREIYFKNKLIFNKEEFDSNLNDTSFQNFFLQNDNNNNQNVNYLSNIFDFINIYKEVSKNIFSSQESLTNLQLFEENNIQSMINISSVETENIILIKEKLYNKKIIPFNLLTLSSKIRFSFIQLPQNLQDITEKTAVSICSICSKHKSHYYMCLLCGQLICFKDCYVNIKDKSFKSIASHINDCSGGYGVVMNSLNASASFIFEHYIFSTKFYLYRNKYGETNSNGYTVTNEFYFSQNDYEKLWENYISKEL